MDQKVIEKTRRWLQQGHVTLNSWVLFNSQIILYYSPATVEPNMLIGYAKPEWTWIQVKDVLRQPKTLQEAW